MQGEIKGHRVKRDIEKKGCGGTSTSSTGMWTVTVCRRSLCMDKHCMDSHLMWIVISMWAFPPAPAVLVSPLFSVVMTVASNAWPQPCRVLADSRKM